MTTRGRIAGGAAVVIPAHNAETTLSPLLAALSRQTVLPREIVVAVDRSTDRTREIARSWEVRVVEVPPPGGPGTARNAGAEATTGDPILFLDADTLPPPDWIERHLNRLAAEGPETLAVWGGYSGPTIEGALPLLAHEDIRWHQASMADYVEVITSANLSVRREAFEAVEGFPDLSVDEDYAFGGRISRLGRVRWDAEIRVGHAFRRTWEAYLRQQFAWARGMPPMYLHSPRLLLASNSFRKDHVLLELGLLAAGIACGIGSLRRPKALLPAALAAAGWAATGLGFRRHLRAAGARGLPVTRYLLFRDLAWLAGLAVGSLLDAPAALRDIARGQRRRGGGETGDVPAAR